VSTTQQQSVTASSANPTSTPAGTAGRRLPTPSAGWTGTIVRVLFGLVFGVDAVLKWLPGYRHTYLAAGGN
jgi:hypothetical protein